MLFISIVSAIEKQKLNQLFVTLNETFPGVLIIANGLQLKEHQPKMLQNMRVVTSAEEFKALLREF